MNPQSAHAGTVANIRRGADEFDALLREGSALAAQGAQVAAAELRLAHAEIRDGLHATGRTAGAATTALLFTSVALFWASAALFFGLASALPNWAAALLTMAMLTVAAGALGLLAKRRAAGISFVPRRAIGAFREDKQWLQEQLSSKSNSAGAAKPSARA